MCATHEGIVAVLQCMQAPKSDTEALARWSYMQVIKDMICYEVVALRWWC